MNELLPIVFTSLDIFICSIDEQANEHSPILSILDKSIDLSLLQLLKE